MELGLDSLLQVAEWANEAELLVGRDDFLAKVKSSDGFVWREFASGVLNPRVSTSHRLPVGKPSPPIVWQIRDHSTRKAGWLKGLRVNVELLENFFDM